MPDGTKVVYDVSQALQALKKLDEQAIKTGKDQKRAFEDPIPSGNRLTSVMGKLAGEADNLSRRVSGIDASMGRYLASLGPAGVATAAVGTAVVGLVANLVDVPGLFADSAVEIENFTRRTQQILQLRDAIGEVDDAFTRAGFKEELDKLNLQQAQTVDRQIELNNARAIANEKLGIERDRLRQLERISAESARKRQSLERQLAQSANQSIVNQTAASGLTAGGAVNALAARARAEASRGNVELAQQLVDEARQRTEELGNHVFYLRQIESAESAIQGQLKKTISEESKREREAGRAVSAIKSRIAALAAEEQQLKKNLNIVRDTQFAIRSERRNVTDQATNQQRSENIGQASEQLTAGIENLRKVLTTQRGGAEGLGDVLQGLKAALTRGGPRFQGEIQQVGGLQDQLQQAVARIEERTPAAIQEGLRGLQSVIEGARALTEQTQDPTGALPGFEKEFEGFATAFEQAVENIAPAVSRALEAGIQRDQRIEESAFPEVQNRIQDQLNASGVIRDSMSSAAQSAELISRNLSILSGNVPSIPANNGVTVEQRTNPASTPQQSVSSNITVNANVKGGIVDREVVEKITDIVNRELRKATGKGVQ